MIFAGDEPARRKFAKVNAHIDSHLDRFVQGVFLEAIRRVTLRTPVRTGRARGNWFPSGDTPSHEKDEAIRDRSGALSIGRSVEFASRVRAGRSYFIMNNLSYIAALEYGSSKQAPQGMVRVTAAELRGLVKAFRDL